MEFDIAEYRSAASPCRVAYHFFGDRCVYVGFEPWTVVFAADIIRAIQDKEPERFLFATRSVNFYDLVPLGKQDAGRYGNSFEFCQVVEDHNCVGGNPLDWLHTHCPTEVLEFFRELLPGNPRQTFTVVGSGQRVIFDW